MGRLLLLLGLGLLSVANAQAELVALQDNEMSAVHGAGIGVVLEQVMMDASQATITINDITNGSGQNVPIKVKEFYLGATGSNKCADNCKDLKPVNIGRLTYPFTLGLDKGEQISPLGEKWVQQSATVNGKTVSLWAPSTTQQSTSTTPSGVAVLSLSFPERLPATIPNPGSGPAYIPNPDLQKCIGGFDAAGGNCSSRAAEKIDMGIRYDFEVATGRTDVLNVDVTELAMDGSYLRLWGDKARKQLVGEARLNIFAKTIDIMTCDPSKPTCNTPLANTPRSSIYLTNVYANLAFGYGKSQPLLLDVTPNGQFVLELPNPVLDPSNPSAPVNTLSGAGKTRADDFYSNAPRTNIVIDNLNFGGTRIAGAVPDAGTYNAAGVLTTPPSVSPTIYNDVNNVNVHPGYNFGRNEISGLSFNYLKVSSHDL